MNYGLAMIISEKLGGKTWEELIKQEIFDPLGMTSSTVMSIIPDLSNAARGYVYTPNYTLIPVEFSFSPVKLDVVHDHFYLNQIFSLHIIEKSL